MKRIQTVLSSDEMLDKAFRRVKKVRISNEKGLKRIKSEAIGRLNALANTLSAQLNKYVRAFPSIDQLHPFERELIDVVIGVDELRHSLGAIDWARKTIGHVRKNEQSAIKSADTAAAVKGSQNSAYGRISSVMDKVSKELDFLREARDTLRQIPDIRPDEPIVVVAGAPNVGKSLLVRQISTGKPEIASYPFTTKGISIGHTTINLHKIQVMDTPGLLDRPLDERNPIELQAIAALEHLEGIFVFIFDPSETCGYDNESQQNLLGELRKTFPNTDFILVSNKADIKDSDIGISISALKGEGVEELMAVIENELLEKGMLGA
jgi:nucleolar GTP-binding protein